MIDSSPILTKKLNIKLYVLMLPFAIMESLVYSAWSDSRELELAGCAAFDSIREPSNRDSGRHSSIFKLFAPERRLE